MDAEQLVRELNLKAMTAISNLLSDYDRGLISRAQANTGCRAVFDTVSGLVSSDTFEYISMAANEFKGAKGCQLSLRKDKTGTAFEGILRICGSGKLIRVRGTPYHAAPPYTAHVDDAVEPDRAAMDAAAQYMRDSSR